MVLTTRLRNLTYFPAQTKIRLTNPHRISIPQRNGRYEPVKFTRNLSENERRRYNLTQHETTHYNIKDKETGKIEAIFTSAQNKDNQHPMSFDKIDSKKLDGSFIPLKDPKTKEFLLDNDGNKMPDPNAGGQFMVTLEKSRQISDDTKHLYEVKKEFQPYVDEHEKEIGSNIEKTRAQLGLHIPKKIGGQDDEPF